MANYKHMEMAEALSNDSRINISRGFLGLKTNLTYAPTSSKINLKVNEYAPDMEGRLTQLLQTDGKTMRSEVEKGKLPTVAVGPFRLEIACSQDYEYLAVQLSVPMLASIPLVTVPFLRSVTHVVNGQNQSPLAIVYGLVVVLLFFPVSPLATM